MPKKLKILICDDSLLVRKKLREDLEKHGCQVFETKDGQEVVQAFADQLPDAVFMDIVMPKMNGLQAMQAIKGMDHSASVIMLSSTGTASKLLEALKLGAMDFIQKPYTDSQISKVLTDIRRKGS